MSKIIEYINERSPMDMSEASAMHKRLIHEAKLAEDKAWTRLNSKPRGVRRRGPLTRKFDTAFMESLQPVIIFREEEKRTISYCYLSYDDDDLALENQLMVSLMVFDKKKVDIQQAFRVGVIISQHASERLIQFLRVRDFDQIDILMAGCYAYLIKMLLNQKRAIDFKAPIVFDNVELGHFILSPHEDYTEGEKEMYIVKTWIGSRSYSKAKADTIRSLGMEVVS